MVLCTRLLYTLPTCDPVINSVSISLKGLAQCYALIMVSLKAIAQSLTIRFLEVLKWFLVVTGYGKIWELPLNPSITSDQYFRLYYGLKKIMKNSEGTSEILITIFKKLN